MNRTLIITDNPELCSFAIDLYHSKLKKKGYFIEFASSGMKSLGVVDLKNDETLEEILREYDVVISLHCTQIFPKKLYENTRCINVHPGYNPCNRGYYPHVHSMINGLPAGATIHEINGFIDGGNIIIQSEVKVDEDDTSLELYERIVDEEKKLIIDNIENIINGNYETTRILNIGGLKTKKDYEKMCNLELNHIGTLKQHIDTLRSLTHGDFNNAYFYNEHGEKIYIKITLTKDEN